MAHDKLPREVEYLANRYRQVRKRITAIDRWVRWSYWLLKRLPDPLAPPVRWFFNSQTRRYNRAAIQARTIRSRIRQYGYTASEINL